MFGRRPTSFRLFDLAGIRVGVDASWFVVLFLVIFLLSTQFKAALSASDGVAYATAVAATLLFFGSIVLHELGHALAARREGIETKAIDLWFFGGLARLSRDARTPGEEFRMAAAGPAVTLLIVLLCAGAGVLLAGREAFAEAAAASGRGISPVLLLVAWLATINLGLLIFNLVPAYPLDGGRLARAAVWRFTGDRGRATRLAARLGLGFACLLGALGLALVLRGSFSGAYLIVFGVLFGSSARAALAQSALAERLEGVRVADIMDPEPVSVPAGMPLARAREEFFDRYGWDWFPVQDGEGRLVGVLREEAFAGAPDDAAAATAADPFAGGRIDETASLDEVVGSEPLHRLGALVALDAEGRVSGVLTLGRVRRALSVALVPERG